MEGFALVKFDTWTSKIYPICCLWNVSGLGENKTKSKSNHYAIIKSFLEDVESIGSPFDNSPLLYFENKDQPRVAKIGWTNGSALAASKPSTISVCKISCRI